MIEQLPAAPGVPEQRVVGRPIVPVSVAYPDGRVVGTVTGATNAAAVTVDRHDGRGPVPTAGD